MTDEKLLTVDEICHYFGIGRNWLIPQQSVQHYIQNELDHISSDES